MPAHAERGTRAPLRSCLASRVTHPSSRDSSSSVSSRSAAAAESVIDCGRFAPGMGMTTGDWASSQASATCCALTPRACATSAKAGCLSASSLASPRPPSGLHGRKARPSSSQTSISGRLLRKAGLNWFWTLDERVAEDGVGGADLVGVRVGEADHGDLAGVGDLLEGADDLVVGDLRVRAVVLPECELLDAETLEAGVDGAVQVLGGAVEVPAAAVGADVAALGGEQDAVAHARARRGSRR